MDSRLDFNNKGLTADGVPIRLLRMLPSSTVQEVSCEIRSGTTGEDYVCLSYCWGDLAECLITVNGSPARVRPNVYAFLREATRRDVRRWIWIDALCINQSNVAERNHQVKNMAAIYQSAERVLIWLGTYIPYWEQISHVSIASRNAFFEHLRDLSAPPEYIDNSLGLDIVKTSSFHIDEPGFRTCLEEIASKPYFQRVWTVQEYLLAKASDIWWGSDVFPAQGLEAAVNDTDNGSPAAEDCYFFDTSNNDRASSQPQDLWRVQRFTHFKEEFGANRPSLINTINKL